MRTHSLCPACYRHLDAEVFEQGGRVLLRKSCPEHGEVEAVVESDLEFYFRTLAGKGRFTEHQEVIVLDVTDKCNLKCHHCYHVPDNGSPNKPVSKVLEDVALTPGSFSIILGGAEPTIRNDLPEISMRIREQGRSVGMLSNGVRCADPDFAARLAPLLNGYVLIGLNHRDYHGEKIHNKQLAGIRNLHRGGVRPMLGYTAEHNELPDILTEAHGLHREGAISLVRLRFGASIGRHPELPVLTLSDHVSALREVCRALHMDFHELEDADNTIYHRMVMIDGMPVRVIQWPDEHNMVLAELVRAPWAKFTGGPISNFCHQIVLRDGLLHKNLPRLDDVPEPYTLNAFLKRMKPASPVPQLNISSSVPDSPYLSNGRYVENVGDVRVANLHGVMTEQQRDAITTFWLEQGAIPDPAEARRRASEVVHLGFDASGNIVAVNTCYPGTLDSGQGPQPYWFYRIFVAPAARSVRLSLELFRLTARHLGRVYRAQGGPVGIAMHLENPKFYRRSGRRSLEWVGIKPLGRDATGLEIWVYDFAGAKQGELHENQ